MWNRNIASPVTIIMSTQVMIGWWLNVKNEDKTAGFFRQTGRNEQRHKTVKSTYYYRFLERENQVWWSATRSMETCSACKSIIVKIITAQRESSHCILHSAALCQDSWWMRGPRYCFHLQGVLQASVKSELQTEGGQKCCWKQSNTGKPVDPLIDLSLSSAL